MQEIVHLKNGSIIRGTIIEIIPNESIKIETRDRSIFVYKMDDIERITKEGRQNNSHKTYNIIGYRGFVDIGLTTAGYGYDSRGEFSTSHGYQFDPYLYAGMGTGIHLYGDSRILVPIFADVRYTFMNRTVSPYVNLRTGYSFKLHGDIDGGYYLSPTGGLRIMLRESFALNLAMGYSLQKIEIGELYSDVWVYNKMNADGFIIRLGIEF